jgi:S-adenosylmethionine hydrolase
MAPVIALLSDFGTRDHYAGTMKGVILGICPTASLVDITHEIPAHDILQGALQLSAAYRYFPAGTIFLSVVDPGVGTTRRAIAVDAGGYLFVAPDNGLLTTVLAGTPAQRIVELTEERYARETVSRTFEGRDRFAPAAAWLARGVDVRAIGRPLQACETLDIPVAAERGGVLHGCVLLVDRFGNVIANIDRRTLERFAGAGPIRIAAAGLEISRVVETYGEIEPGEVCALFGSTERLELAVRGGSAAARLGTGPGAPVEISRAG